MQREEARLLTPGPAGATGRFHQQDRNCVGTHLWTTPQKQQDRNVHEQKITQYNALPKLDHTCLGAEVHYVAFS